MCASPEPDALRRPIFRHASECLSWSFELRLPTLLSMPGWYCWQLAAHWGDSGCLTRDMSSGPASGCRGAVRHGSGSCGSICVGLWGPKRCRCQPLRRCALCAGAHRLHPVLCLWQGPAKLGAAADVHAPRHRSAPASVMLKLPACSTPFLRNAHCWQAFMSARCS